jgi:cyclic pyranopterin phosphate synthase
MDSLDADTVKQITGSDSLPKVLEALKAVKDAGFTRTKVNMVPLPGVNTQDIESMIRFCMEAGFTLRLIEVMPMGVSGQRLDYLDLQKVIEDAQDKFGLIESKRIHGGGPARYWETADGEFSLGFITPRSQHFCETCNRVRMTADGVLHLCLGQNDSFDLKPYLRSDCSDHELEEALRLAIELKPEKHEFNEKPEQIIRIMAKTGG